MTSQPDPFDFPAVTTTTTPAAAAAAPPSASTAPPREPAVLQAVSFLSDPRVRAADPSKALDFLRGKGVSDDELREAYRRAGQTAPASLGGSSFGTLPQLFPPSGHAHAHASPLGGTHQLVPMGHPAHPLAHPPPPQQQQQGQLQTGRPTWVSVFLGLTAAAGLYTAVREVLRHYVVPLYFPEAARVAEERRRREEHTLASQERQIAELRERIHDLCASTERNSSRVEQLSKSLSSSLALREREASQASELRDAIQQLSHSITASGGTGRGARSSVGADTITEAGEDGTDGAVAVDGTEYLRRIQGGPARKSGSLSYSYANAATTARLPDPRAGEDSDTEDDEFMNLEPAQVDESWRADVAGIQPASATRVSAKRAAPPALNGDAARGRCAGGADADADADANADVDVDAGTDADAGADADNGRDAHGGARNSSAEDMMGAIYGNGNGGAVGAMNGSSAMNGERSLNGASAAPVDEAGAGEQAGCAAACATNGEEAAGPGKVGEAVAAWEYVEAGGVGVDGAVGADGESGDGAGRAGDGGEGEGEGESESVARRLFRTEALLEASALLGDSGDGLELGTGGKRGFGGGGRVTAGARPLSMPMMDPPLSDPES